MHSILIYKEKQEWSIILRYLDLYTCNEILNMKWSI